MVDLSKLLVVLSAPLLIMLAQPPASKSTHTVLRTTGAVVTSKNGTESILNIILRNGTSPRAECVEGLPAGGRSKSKEYQIDADYQIVTDGATREAVTNGQRTVTVFLPSEAQPKAFTGDYSGPCCVAGDASSGYRGLRPCQPPQICRLHSSPAIDTARATNLES
jgi:hypothetical protein